MIPKKPVVILCRDCWKPKEHCNCTNNIASELNQYATNLKTVFDKYGNLAWCILLTEQDRLFLKQIHINAE